MSYCKLKTENSIIVCRLSGGQTNCLSISNISCAQRFDEYDYLVLSCCWHWGEVLLSET